MLKNRIILLFNLFYLMVFYATVLQDSMNLFCLWNWVGGSQHLIGQLAHQVKANSLQKVDWHRSRDTFIDTRWRSKASQMHSHVDPRGLTVSSVAMVELVGFKHPAQDDLRMTYFLTPVTGEFTLCTRPVTFKIKQPPGRDSGFR